MNEIEAIRAEAAEKERQARARQQVEAERAEVRRDALTQVTRQLDTSHLDPQQQHQLAATFAGGSDEQLAGWRAARHPQGPGGDAAAMFSNPDGSTNHFARVVGGDEPAAVLVPPGEEVPGGWEEVEVDLAQIRRDAEHAKALANARRERSRVAGIAGDDAAPFAGYSEDGVGYRTGRGGERIAELRPKPLSAEEDLESILSEVPGLLEGFSEDQISEALRLIRENHGRPEMLSLVAATQSIVPGPEPGTKFAHRRLVNFDPSPEGGYPSVETHGEGTRTYTLRRVFEKARERRDTRLVAGSHAGEFFRGLWG